MTGTVRLTLHLLVALLLVAAPVSAQSVLEDVRLACCNSDTASPGPDEECPNPVCSAFPGPLSILTETHHAPHLAESRHGCVRAANLTASGPPSRPAEIPPEIS